MEEISVKDVLTHKGLLEALFTIRMDGHEAIVALKILIKKLRNQIKAKKEKFDYCHSKEFQEERSRLRHERLSFDRIKEIQKMKNPREKIKALEDLQKREKEIDKRLEEMDSLSNFWTCENIEKNCEEISTLESKIEECEIAMMFIPTK